ncbi:5652_t:CDS:1, partial [Funneliformis geosporum]
MTNNEKGKVPETPQPKPKKILPHPPINNSRPNGENSLNASIHAMNDWADESEYLHPNSKGYAKSINDINDHEQPDRIDLLMTKLDAVSTQLGRLHEDLQFTNERVSTMESLLKIYPTSPKQAAIINAQLTGENMEEEEYIVRPGIDISESVITTQKIDIKTLQDENLHLKRNLQAN